MSAEVKLPCGCYAEPYRHGEGWAITASAFLCPANHRQGDITYAAPAPSVGDAKEPAE